MKYQGRKFTFILLSDLIAVLIFAGTCFGAASVQIQWKDLADQKTGILSSETFPFRFSTESLAPGQVLVIPLNGRTGAVRISGAGLQLQADGKQVLYAADQRSNGKPCVLITSLPAGDFEVELRVGEIVVTEEAPNIFIDTDQIFVRVCTEGYVSGVCAESFFDKKTGARDVGWGLDIVDWLMQSNPAEAAVDGTAFPPPYDREQLLHNRIAKPYVELPQICTQAKKIPFEVIRGAGFVAVHQWWSYTEANPGYEVGSRWDQWLVFIPGVRHFFSSDTVTSQNSVGSLILRTDLPGHVKHNQGDSFKKIWLSYFGEIPASGFEQNFPPEARYFYKRGVSEMPQRLIRAYQLKAPSGLEPWLGGLTLAPETVSESWCHQRGYVCFIQEIGRIPVSKGDRFSSAYVIGYFDSIEEMTEVYDRYQGNRSLAATPDGFSWSKDVVFVQDGRLKTGPWGLSPDSLTEGDWRGPGHLPWHLENVKESGTDSKRKVAGKNSLFFLADPTSESSPASVEWGDYGDIRNEWPAKADYQRTLPGIHDVKDLQIYRFLKFSLMTDTVSRSDFKVILYSVDRKSSAEYRFQPPVGTNWKEIMIDLDHPDLKSKDFNRQYTGAVRLEFPVDTATKIWLDNFHLLEGKNRTP